MFFIIKENVECLIIVILVFVIKKIIGFFELFVYEMYLGSNGN